MGRTSQAFSADHRYGIPAPLWFGQTRPGARLQMRVGTHAMCQLFRISPRFYYYFYENVLISGLLATVLGEKEKRNCAHTYSLTRSKHVRNRCSKACRCSQNSQSLQTCRNQRYTREIFNVNLGFHSRARFRSPYP